MGRALEGWGFGEGGRVYRYRGNAEILYLQYGSKYENYYVIIFFVEQYKNITNGDNNTYININSK